MKSLADWKVWKLVDLPPGRKPVKCRWVFVAKSNGHKETCLVAKGFTQVYGIDFKETFSPVAWFETIHLAVLEDWDIVILYPCLNLQSGLPSFPTQPWSKTKSCHWTSPQTYTVLHIVLKSRCRLIWGEEELVHPGWLRHWTDSR